VLGSPWDTIVVSHYTTCGLKGGRAACWGSDVWGALGQGKVLMNCPSPIGGGAGCRLAPRPVVGNHVFQTLAAGGQADRGVGPPFSRFACGIESSGQAFCWGSDTNGELGDGAQYPNENPTPIRGALGVTWSAIWSGMDHSCGLDRNGKAYCWGAEMWGEIGDDAPPPQQTFTPYGAVPIPSPVLGGLTFRQVEAGRVHSCGVTTAGEVYCWGYNGLGHLGTPTVDCSTDPRYPAPCSATPVKVQSSQTFTYVTTGLAHTCALATTGAIWCWGLAVNVGAGSPTQLGVPCPADPRIRCVLTPIQTKTSVRFKQVDAGMNFTCAVSTTQKIYCWGSDFYGLAKTGTAEFTPTMINQPAN
jgi:alpha-tubulin suppressor-like RCC1 family protein